MATPLAAQVWYPPANPSGLSALEVSAGRVLGQGDAPLLSADPTTDPITVLRDLARTLLAAPPCVIAFSGGRDSSALLAEFVHVARTEGLPEPIAATARWDNDDASDESSWQEQVVRTVGIENWEIVRPGDNLDLLGPEATGALEQVGLMWPAPAYVSLPLIRLAAGGTYVSGEGGDEAFGLWEYERLWTALRGRHLPRLSEVRGLALGCTPRAVRRRRWARHLPEFETWLRPDARAQLIHAVAEECAGEPMRWDKYLAFSRQTRARERTVETFDHLCAVHDTRFVGPFLDKPFLSALAAWGGAIGKGDRTAVMTALFSDVLPEAVLARTSKATFGGVFWGPSSRRFAESWDGSGLDATLVDTDALRRAWLEPVPVFASALPLHAAWLYHHVMSQSGASNG
jgi:asparagine synthase (glutamine-hydrolysing)